MGAIKSPFFGLFLNAIYDLLFNNSHCAYLCAALLPLANIIIIVSMLQTEIEFFRFTPENSFNILWIAEFLRYEGVVRRSVGAVHICMECHQYINIRICIGDFLLKISFKNWILWLKFTPSNLFVREPSGSWQKTNFIPKVIEFKIAARIAWHGILFS